MAAVFTTEAFLRNKLTNMKTKLLELGADEQQLNTIEKHITVGGSSLTSYAIKLHTGEHDPDVIINRIVDYSGVQKKKRDKAHKLVREYMVCVQDATWSLVPHPS